MVTSNVAKRRVPKQKGHDVKESLAYSSSSSSLPSLGSALSCSSASCFLLRVDIVLVMLADDGRGSMDGMGNEGRRMSREKKVGAAEVQRSSGVPGHTRKIRD